MHEQTLEFTGERMVPGLADATTFWEHVARYKFANKFIAGRDVLDIACGEGYGTASLIRRGARTAVGIDIAIEAVEHARRKYGVDARVGSAEEIPLLDASVDVVVSFETIEHVRRPGLFVKECLRVLRPGGRLIISTPNIDVYRTYLPNNPFHCSEMSVVDFDLLLQEGFSERKFYGQGWGTAWYLRVRGIQRAVRLSRKLLRVPHPTAVTAETAENVVALCAQRQGVLDRMLSTDSIRTFGAHELAKCTYVVATAVKSSK